MGVSGLYSIIFSPAKNASPQKHPEYTKNSTNKDPFAQNEKFFAMQYTC